MVRYFKLGVAGLFFRSCNDFGLVADFLHENHCGVLFAEQRGQNNSGGDYMRFGVTERYDCLEWARWATENISSDLPIYLCGVSMGATTVLMAAGLKLPKNLHGIMADCGFTSPDEIWRHIANNNHTDTETLILSRKLPTCFRDNNRLLPTGIYDQAKEPQNRSSCPL